MEEFPREFIPVSSNVPLPFPKHSIPQFPTKYDIASVDQTAPCPNYALWKKAIQIDGAVLQSSGEFHGDCRITFQVPHPESQRFLLRFESAHIRECHDRLIIYDWDDVLDATRLDELSCRSQADPTRFFYTTNAGGFVTVRYYTYNKGQFPSEFQLILTAVSKSHDAECKFRCANGHCISGDLRCDTLRVNHCGDNSDELNCRNGSDEQNGGDGSDILGLSITVTIIISLSILFVGGVCVCSVVLFICKRNQLPARSEAPQSHQVEVMSSSDATTSDSQHMTSYTPVLTDGVLNGREKHGDYHGRHKHSECVLMSFAAGFRSADFVGHPPHAQPYKSSIVQLFPPEYDIGPNRSRLTSTSEHPELRENECSRLNRTKGTILI